MAFAFAIGLSATAILCYLTMIHTYRIDDSYAMAIKRLAKFLFGVLLIVIGMSIWAIFRHTSLSYNEKDHIVVGLVVGVLGCLFVFWFRPMQIRKWRWPLVVHVGLFAALAPSIWAIFKKISWDQDIKVSVTVGVEIDRPCLVCAICLILS